MVEGDGTIYLSTLFLLIEKSLEPLSCWPIPFTPKIHLGKNCKSWIAHQITQMVTCKITNQFDVRLTYLSWQSYWGGGVSTKPAEYLQSLLAKSIASNL